MNKKIIHIGIVTIILVVGIGFILSLGAKGDDGLDELNTSITQAEREMIASKTIHDKELKEYKEALSGYMLSKQELDKLYEKKKDIMSSFTSGATTP